MSSPPPAKRPIKTVVACLDLQAKSREVVAASAQIACLASARLVLLHVTEPPGSVRLPRSLKKSLVDRWADEGARGLEIERKRLEKASTPVEVRHVRGRPAHRVIVKEARGMAADLLIFGAHGRAANGAAIGSTADRLLRTSPVPCLVVRGRTRFPLRRMAAATDFSDEANEAVRLAAEWLDVLGRCRTHLDLIHVGNRSYRALDPALEELCEAILEGEVVRVAEEARLDHDRLGLHLEWADHPVDGIVTALEGGDHDLVAVGTHGHGRVRRTLLGGVPVALAQRSPCPVLVVPG